jgi:uncharacterized metal-binding protein
MDIRYRDYRRRDGEVKRNLAWIVAFEAGSRGVFALDACPLTCVKTQRASLSEHA